jgi:hypothetical protein
MGQLVIHYISFTQLGHFSFNVSTGPVDPPVFIATQMEPLHRP